MGLSGVEQPRREQPVDERAAAMSERSRAAGSTRRLGRALRWAALLLAIVAAGLAVTPLVMVWSGTRRARACFAAFEEPRTAPPDCSGLVDWFFAPAYVPWTSWEARYRAEELLVRQPVYAYVDAAIGSAKREDLARATPPIREAMGLLAGGSRRIALEQLGPAMGAPDPGRLADDVGDRQRLIDGGEGWTEWQVRMHSIDAALLEGNLPRATALARRYLEFDPRDEDLRTQLGALLCLEDDPRRGLELLIWVQDDRASRRYAAMSRDWGEVRAVILACVARAGLPPPPRPTASEAGRADAPEARAVLRVRLTALPSQAGGKGSVAAGKEEPRQALEGAVELLRSPPRTTIGRRALLGVLLASAHPTDAQRAAQLCHTSTKDGEPALSGLPAITASDLLVEPTSLRPIAPAAGLLRAAERLRTLAAGADATVGPALRSCAGALLLEAARALALAGDGAGAASRFDAAGELLDWSAAARALARSSAYWLAGDLARAVAESAGELGEPATDADRLVHAGTLLQRAELAAAQGRAEDAATLALAADEAARRSGSHALDARARWTRVALAPRGQRLREPWKGKTPAWRWIGYGETTGRWADDLPGGPLEETLAAWDAARVGGEPERRAARYRVFHARGDAPPWTVVHLALGQALAPAGGDVETWLDAFYAIDHRRISRTAYAWSRAQAASMRGAADVAALWRERQQKLAAIATDPERAEIARFLGL